MSENALGKASSDSSPSDKTFPCLECDKVYESHQGLSYHYKTTECDGPECPECGDSHFVSKHGLARHYGRTHDGHYSVHERLMDAAWFREKYHKEGYSTADIADLVGCARCVAQTWKDRHGIKTNTDHKSRGCGEDNPTWVDNMYEVECDYCGETTEVIKQRLERGEHNFCDNECMSRWKSENWVGDNNPLHTGGPAKYGPNWKEQRAKAWKRDQYRCQRCMRSEAELGEKPAAHHIRKIKKFKAKYDAPEWYERGNRLDNLLCLCRSCHPKWEGIPLRIDNR